MLQYSDIEFLYYGDYVRGVVRIGVDTYEHFVPIPRGCIDAEPEERLLAIFRQAEENLSQK